MSITFSEADAQKYILTNTAFLESLEKIQQRSDWMGNFFKNTLIPQMHLAYIQQINTHLKRSHSIISVTNSYIFIL